MASRIIEADCVEAMAEMDEASVDAVVCDPPYGLEFMGKEWDAIGRSVGPGGKTRDRDTAIEGREGEKWQPGSTYGTPGKNPRCLHCLKLRFDHENRKCQCEMPLFHARGGEYGSAQEAWHYRWATQALRVLKPGGHLLAFGGTRTYHRLACAIEDAGFEIRDSLIWIYGSGFPKSLDVSKAIDKAAGAEREVVGVKPGHENFVGREDHPLNDGWDRPWASDPEAVARYHAQTAPATPQAQQWQGWGTALKPAHEPIVLARKPLVGTVAANVLEHGCGALNIDGTRIKAGDGDREDYGLDGDEPAGIGYHGLEGRTAYERPAAGRWPANCVLSHLPECERVGVRRVKSGPSPYVQQTESGGYGGDLGNVKGELSTHYADPDGTEQVPAYTCAPGCPVAMLDEQSGDQKSPAPYVRSGAVDAGLYEGRIGVKQDGHEQMGYGDTGGASRFFYTAKASRGERNAGLEGFEAKDRVNGNKWTDQDYRVTRGERTPGRESGPRQNVHPTVKPIDLMRWLCRLVTPPGGTILDPFAGSGTTGIAAHLEGFDFIGIEREPEYAEIARARIAWWEKLPVGTDVADALGLSSRETKARESGQGSLL